MKATDLDRVYGKAGALPKTARWLLLNLASRCRPDGALPMSLTDNQLAEAAGCSARSMARARELLFYRGVIDYENEGKHGLRYRVLIPALVDADEIPLPYEAAQ